MSDISLEPLKGSQGNTASIAQLVDYCTIPLSVITKIGNDQKITLTYSASDGAAYKILLSQSCTIDVSNNQSGYFQKIILFLQQPYKGNCEVTFSEIIQWQGRHPFIDSRAGKTSIVEILTDGADNHYGRMIYG